MKEITPVIRRMKFDEAYQLGLHSRGLILEHQGRNYHLNAVLSDKVYVFTRSICIFILTVNRLLGYIGLDVYMSNEPDPINTIFLHSDYQITESLGRRWEQLSPRTIAERLVEYLI